MEEPQGRRAGTALQLLRIDPEIERNQVERLVKLRARRDAARVKHHTPSSGGNRAH